MLGTVALLLCFGGGEKYCDPLSIFTKVSNVFVVFCFDKDPVLVVLFRGELLTAVVTCEVLYTKHFGTTNIFWVMGTASCDGYACRHNQSPFLC